MRAFAAHFYDSWLICNLIRMLKWNKLTHTSSGHSERNNKYCHKLYDTENSINCDGDDAFLLLIGLYSAFVWLSGRDRQFVGSLRLWYNSASSSSVHCRSRFWETTKKKTTFQWPTSFFVVRCSMCDAVERSLKWYIRTTPHHSDHFAIFDYFFSLRFGWIEAQKEKITCKRYRCPGAAKRSKRMSRARLLSLPLQQWQRRRWR